MNDLISRKALIAEYDRVHIGPPGGARKLMEDAPGVDAVEMVRCQNCTYHNTNACPKNRVWCKRLSRYMDPDGYCSYGKGKDQ